MGRALIVSIVAVVVFAAASTAHADEWCAPTPPKPAVLSAPACWSPATTRRVTDAIGIELATYGIELTPGAADAGAVAIRIDGACNGDDASVTVYDSTRHTERRVPLADVGARHTPRMLALAIGELFAKPCPTAPVQAVAPAATTAAVTAPGATLAPPPRREPTGIARSVTTTSPSPRVNATAELAWFRSPASLHRGAAITVEIPVDGGSAFAGAVALTDGAADPIGSVTVRTFAVRAGAARDLATYRAGIVTAVGTVDLGATSGIGVADSIPATGASTRAVYVAARGGMSGRLWLATQLQLGLTVTAGYGRGLVAAADSRALTTTGGASIAGSAGLTLSF